MLFHNLHSLHITMLFHNLHSLHITLLFTIFTVFTIITGDYSQSSVFIQEYSRSGEAGGRGPLARSCLVSLSQCSVLPLLITALQLAERSSPGALPQAGSR